MVVLNATPPNRAPARSTVGLRIGVTISGARFDDFASFARFIVLGTCAGHPSIMSTLLPAAPTAPSVMGEPPIGRHVVFCGVKIFRIADGTVVERWRPETVS